MTEVEVMTVKVPQVEPEQPEPDSVHVTPLLAGSSCTDAVKPAVVEICTDFVEGDTVTEIVDREIELLLPQPDNARSRSKLRGNVKGAARFSRKGRSSRRTLRKEGNVLPAIMDSLRPRHHDPLKLGACPRRWIGTV